MLNAKFQMKALYFYWFYMSEEVIYVFLGHIGIDAH